MERPHEVDQEISGTALEPVPKGTHGAPLQRRMAGHQRVGPGGEAEAANAAGSAPARGAGEPKEPSDRDYLVAATVAQWFGSPVGVAFVADAWLRNDYPETKPGTQDEPPLSDRRGRSTLVAQEFPGHVANVSADTVTVEFEIPGDVAVREFPVREYALVKGLRPGDAVVARTELLLPPPGTGARRKRSWAKAFREKQAKRKEQE